jgi:hypothetical protein
MRIAHQAIAKFLTQREAYKMQNRQYQAATIVSGY